MIVVKPARGHLQEGSTEIMKTEVVYTRQITQEQVENIRKLCQASEKKTEDAQRLARLDAQAGFGRRKGRKP